MMKKEKFRLLVCSANMGNRLFDEESLKSWIPLDGDVVEVVFGKSYNFKEGKRPNLGKFDIIAVGMQEYFKGQKEQTNWIMPSRSNIRGSLGKMSSYMSNHKDILQEKDEIDDLILDHCPSYDQIVDFALGETRLIIMVKNYLKRHITHVECNSRATGMGNVLANKGGVIATIYLKETRLTFITAHLAAHEGEAYYHERCSNVTDILSKTSAMSGFHGYDAALASHHCFLFGDLNYRLNHDDYFDASQKSSENPSQDYSLKDDIYDLISNEHWEELSKRDGLTKAIENQECLYGFNNPLCKFPPTFKVKRCKGIFYNPQRTPSYTDRILWTSSDALEDDVKLLNYECCSNFSSSDHKPVRGAFLLTRSCLSKRRLLPRSLSGKYSMFRRETNITISQFRMKVDASCSNYYVKVDAIPASLVDVNNLLKLKKVKRSPDREWVSDDLRRKGNTKCEITFALAKSGEELQGGLLFISIVGDSGASFAGELGRSKKLIGSAALNLYELYNSRGDVGESAKSLDYCRDKAKYFTKTLVRNGIVRGSLSFSLSLWNKDRSMRKMVSERKLDARLMRENSTLTAQTA